MRHIGINMAPVFWGFMAASTETLGCLLFVIGLFFRPSALMLFLTMLVAAISDFDSARGTIHSSFGEAAHALELALVFFALMFIGPGKFSFDKG